MHALGKFHIVMAHGFCAGD